MYVNFSKEPWVYVKYNKRIVTDRDGLIKSFEEAGYVIEVSTAGESKFMKGEKTQNEKTNLVDIQMAGRETVFETSKHLDIKDFELLETFLVDYQPKTSL